MSDGLAVDRATIFAMLAPEAGILVEVREKHTPPRPPHPASAGTCRRPPRLAVTDRIV